MTFEQPDGKNNNPSQNDIDKEVARKKKIRSWVSRGIQATVLIVIVVLIAIGNSQIGNAIDKFRVRLRRVPLGTGILVFLAISIPRKLFPILYYLFPIGTLTALYLADKLGPNQGAFIYQLIKLQDLVYLPILRKLFSDIAKDIFEPESIDPTKKSFVNRYISKDIRSALRILDKRWIVIYSFHSKYHESEESLSYRIENRVIQSSIVILWQIAFYMEEYINLFWLACRSQIPIPLYWFSFCVSLVIDYPKEILKMRAALGFVNVSSGLSSVSQVLKNVADFTWYEVGGIALCGLATLIVHGVHVQLVVSNLYSFFRKLCCGPPNDSLGVTLASL